MEQHQGHPCPFYPQHSAPLFYAKSDGGTPFRVCLHAGDLGHTVIVGPTGAGKSTLLGLIAAQQLRYPNAQVFAFDKGYSMQPLVWAAGGQHYDIAGDATGELAFCPLGRIDDPAEQDWAAEWVENLVALQGVSIVPEHRKRIYEAIVTLAGSTQKPEHRTLTNLVNTVQDRPSQGLTFNFNSRKSSMAFLKPKAQGPQSPGKGNDSANPYLNARREWDERYGNLIVRARNWRYAAFCAFGIAALAVAGVVWIGSQSKIQPYVVQVDQLGGPVAVAMPVRDSQKLVTQRVAEALVSNWVWDARTVLNDQNAQKVLIDRVYAMAGANASAFLSGYYKDNPPFGFTRSVSITSVMPLSQDSFQVTWDEVKVQSGQQVVEHWKANITISVDPNLANTPQVNLASPMGLYIREVTWTQIFAGATSAAGK
jgi:type IV secretion system protein VirB5